MGVERAPDKERIRRVEQEEVSTSGVPSPTKIMSSLHQALIRSVGLGRAGEDRARSYAILTLLSRGLSP